MGTLSSHTTPRDRASTGSLRLAPLPGSAGSSAKLGNSGTVPPLDLGLPSPGSIRSGSLSESGRGSSVMPPPDPIYDRVAEKLAARKRAGSATPESGASRRLGEKTERKDTVKWVPHTHANPKHAKFCFICLYGKLEGDRDAPGTGEDKVNQKMVEDEMPNAVELRDLNYLVPTASVFKRVGADYEQNNCTAQWLREVSDRVYNETIRNMVVETNNLVANGIDVRLADEKEDDVDREQLERMFTMSADEEKNVEEKLDRLRVWCEAQENRLLDVMPPQPELDSLPAVDPLTELQADLMEYKPLIDLSQLKGETALEARDVIRQIDADIDGNRGNKPTVRHPASASVRYGRQFADGFQVADLPRPATYPEMPGFEVFPYPVSTADVPAYSPQQPRPPVKHIVRGTVDPFPHPHFHLPAFQENLMPSFTPPSDPAILRYVTPEPCKQEWLTKTCSIWPDNNPPFDDSEGAWDWGRVPPRHVPMPPMLDEPYYPPHEIIQGPDGQRLIMRGIWDPALVSMNGTHVPAIRERGELLYRKPEFVHQKDAVWTKNLAPTKPRDYKVRELVNLYPVLSLTRFEPHALSAKVPEFLWDLARETPVGQGLWDAVDQRHEVPGNYRKMLDAENESLQKERDAFQAAIDMSATAPDAGASTIRFAATEDGATAETRPRGRVVREEVKGLPDIAAEIPDAPLPAGMPPPPGSEQDPFSENYAGPGEASADTMLPAAVAAAGGTATAQRRPTAAERTTILRVHEDRLRGTGGPTAGGGATQDAGGMQSTEGRSVEELFSDDRFLDSLADRIASRMGASTGFATANGQGTQAASATQGAAGRVAVSGRPNQTIMRPIPPSFAEPADEQSRAELPRALQGAGGPSTQGRRSSVEEQTTTVMDVNTITQEKMRNECYVRLLIKPEAVAAQKLATEYKGQARDPDGALIMGRGRPNLRIPPQPTGRVDDEGNIIEEDEWEKYEKDDTIVFSFVRHNRYESVESLIQKEVSVLDVRDDSGNNLLHVACQNNNRRMAKLLLRNMKKEKMDEKNNRGNTPLHYCYQYQFTQLAEYLVANGASLEIQNNLGYYPTEGTGATAEEPGVASAQKKLQQRRV